MTVAEKVESKVPQLRFPEFKDSWSKKTIDDLSVAVTSGSRDWAKYYSDTGEKFIRMTNLPKTGINLLLEDLRYVNIPNNSTDGLRTSLQEGDILMSITAELGKIGLVPSSLGKAYINQHTALIRPDKNKITPGFLAQMLASDEARVSLNRLNDSGAKAGLNLSTIRNFKRYSTSLEESKKVNSFLFTVDKKISLLKQKHEQLVQYKKGVMQQLFSQKLRFKDDNGQDFPDWEVTKFKQNFTRVSRKNKDNNLNVLTISGQRGLINQQKYFNKSVSAQDVTGYYLIDKGEFAYNKSYSKGYPMGAIKRLNNYEQGVVSTLYICFKSINGDDRFWEQYFESGLLNREIQKIAQEGARNHGLLNVSVKEFFDDMKVYSPNNDEQAKIANFLESIDKKINLTQQKIEQTQAYKKGLLQQMFV